MINEIRQPLIIEIILDAGIDKVWEAWTSRPGIRSFFAPVCKINPKVGADYEIYFFPKQKEGERGAERTKILAIEPKRFLSFTWNNPPSIPEIRWQYAVVSLYFEPIDDKHTRLKLIHAGRGTGKSWQKAREYFNHAWGQVVLLRLIKIVDNEPMIRTDRN